MCIFPQRFDYLYRLLLPLSLFPVVNLFPSIVQPLEIGKLLAVVLHFPFNSGLLYQHSLTGHFSHVVFLNNILGIFLSNLVFVLVLHDIFRTVKHYKHLTQLCIHHRVVCATNNHLCALALVYLWITWVASFKVVASNFVDLHHLLHLAVGDQEDQRLHLLLAVVVAVVLQHHQGKKTRVNSACTTQDTKFTKLRYNYRQVMFPPVHLCTLTFLQHLLLIHILCTKCDHLV